MRFFNTILLTIISATTFLCSCGEDRSSEFYELTEENRWIYDAVKERYLWKDSITEPANSVFFATGEKFLSQIIYKNDKVSSFVDDTPILSYGITFSLMRDPLAITPAKVYALIENVEPQSVAGAAGLERGMYISAIDGKSLNMGSNTQLYNGDGIEVGVCSILLDQETGTYSWSEEKTLSIAAATEVEVSPLPVVTTIDDELGKTGYIQCNNFDEQETIANLQDALSTFIADGVSNIVIDLRYNESDSFFSAAEVAAMLVPSDKQGTTFATLYKNIALSEKEDILLPQTSVSIGNDTGVYIITSGRTSGVASALIKALQHRRDASSFCLVGETATARNIFTERIDSPYEFAINIATAFVYDSNGALLQPLEPNYTIEEFNDYKSIFPLGDKNEHLLHSIRYLIANGALPE